ncbi:hypothetical protein EPN52_08795 [bacterium]|nr:MAG: hypothetical protein EPN52_08795 [bacterium]
MRVVIGPTVRIDDYAAAAVGLAAGSVMLWIGPESLAAPAGPARLLLVVVGALVAILALAFVAANLLNAPPAWRNLARAGYAAALAAAGATVFPAAPGSGALLAALAVTPLVMRWGQRTLGTALGLTGSGARAALKRAALLLTLLAAALLISLDPARGNPLALSIVWPVLAGIAAAAVIGLRELVTALTAVSATIRSRDRALTLAHELTLGTFGMRETAVVQRLAEQAVDSYFGLAGCAHISAASPAAALEGAALEWPRVEGAATVIRYPLRAASATLEVRLPMLSDDDLTSLALLADTADLSIGASALLCSLGEERRLLEQIFADVPIGIVLSDEHGNIVVANEAAGALAGEVAGALTGAGLTEALGLEGLHEGRALVGRARHPVEVHVRPVGEGKRSLTLLRDLTEQEAVEALKSEFIAAVSHDLRTPLTAVKGFAVLLQERTDLDPAVREILRLIDRAANRLTRMIDDLMQSALLESGRLALLVEPIPLGAAVRGLGLLESESPTHHLVLEVPPTLGVLADRDRLEQVLVNLVTNAYKYTPGGRVLVRARAAGERVEIAVSDDGPGIAPAEQVHIFEKFYQANATSKKRRGVGLGLYISRELIERMGGTLTVRSVPGFGATFAISLRRAELGIRAERSA